MSKDNVIEFPGCTLNDLDPDQVLNAAVDKLEDAIVIGWTKDKKHLWFASSNANVTEINWLLDMAKDFLLHSAVKE